MAALWSDYVLKLCARCQRRMYHERGASACLACQIGSR